MSLKTGSLLVSAMSSSSMVAIYVWKVIESIIGVDKTPSDKEPHWQCATVHGLITEVKQLWARSILGWVTIQDTVLVAKKDVIVTCHVPLWLMSYEYTRGSQSAP